MGNAVGRRQIQRQTLRFLKSRRVKRRTLRYRDESNQQSKGKAGSADQIYWSAAVQLLLKRRSRRVKTRLCNYFRIQADAIAATQSFASQPSECENTMAGWVFTKSALVMRSGTGTASQTAPATLKPANKPWIPDAT